MCATETHAHTDTYKMQVNVAFDVLNTGGGPGQQTQLEETLTV